MCLFAYIHIIIFQNHLRLKLQTSCPFKYFSVSPESKEILLENRGTMIKIGKFNIDAYYYLTYGLYLNFTNGHSSPLSPHRGEVKAESRTERGRVSRS